MPLIIRYLINDSNIFRYYCLGNITFIRNDGIFYYQKSTYYYPDILIVLQLRRYIQDIEINN